MEKERNWTVAGFGLEIIAGVLVTIEPFIAMPVSILGGAAIVWGLWPQKIQSIWRWRRQPTTRDTAQIVPQQVPADNNLIAPDPALRIAIDEIYAVFQRIEDAIDNTRPGFDQQSILEAGKAEYIEMLQQYKNSLSGLIGEIADLCENKYGNHADIYNFRFETLGEFGTLRTDINLVIGKLNKFPDEINEGMLDLIKDEIELLKKSCGIAIKWSRQCQDILRKLRAVN